MAKPAALTVERRTRKRFSPWRVSRLVFVLAIALIVLASAALLYVGFVASQAADAEALKSELRLFDNALRDRQVLMAREQLALARWTKSYESIAQSFDEEYIFGDIVETLWHDSAHDLSFLVGGGDQLLMAAIQDKADFTRKTLSADDPVRVIAQRAVARFMQNRIKTADGFLQKPVTARDAAAVAEFAFARMNGEPALVSAVAVVPDDDDGVGMPDGPPVILVSAKFLRGAFTRELNAQLAFRDFSFEQGAAPSQPGVKPITGMDGKVLGQYVWTSEHPGRQLWSTVIPVVTLLALALALAAILIARVIGQIAARLEESEARNRTLALHDALTGLANRLQLRQALDEAVARLPGARFAVIACDLDRFKAVNDTFGHAGGDTLIRVVAGRLAQAVGDAGLVARTGGDEFIILLTGYTDVPRLTALTQAIISSVCSPVDLEGAKADVGISLGVAVAPEHGVTADGVMAAADTVLYEAKARGKGIAVFAHDALPAPPAPVAG